MQIVRVSQMEADTVEFEDLHQTSLCWEPDSEDQHTTRRMNCMSPLEYLVQIQTLNEKTSVT